MGDVLGRYTIRQFLGRGGMGRVYRADGPDGEVALKLVHPQFLERDDFLRRFLLESGAGKRVRHPNVVKTHGLEVIEHGGRKQAVLVMEYVPGRTLLNLQTDLGRVPDGFLRAIAEGVVAGLDSMHSAGVIHRDLKPENVMLTADHRVKIMDLGVARMSEEQARLSRTGHFVGSLLFASPEQLSNNGTACGPSTDLYAAGLLLYVLATGSHPFSAGTAGEIIAAHLHTVPQPVRERQTDVSPFLAAVIEVLLAKSPLDRFSSAGALLDVLQLGESSPWWRARQERGGAHAPPRPRLNVQRSHPLRGRGDALRNLSELWRATTCGRGSLVLIEGDAGVGKSRLIDAFVDMLALAPSQVVLLEPARVGAPLSMGALAERLGDGGPANATHVEGEERLHQVLGQRTENGPLLLVVDRPTQVLLRAGEALATLGEVASKLPLLVLCAERPLKAEMRRGCLRAHRAAVFPLSPLSTVDAIRVLEDLGLSPAVLEELGPSVCEYTGANPRLLIDVVESLQSRRILRKRSDGLRERVDHEAPLGVPSASRPLLESRLTSLSKREQRVLQAACVQGHEVDLDLMARVLGLPGDACRAELLAIGAPAPIFTFDASSATFRPPLLREVVLEASSRSTRAHWHERTARALTARHVADLPLHAPRLVHHYLAAAKPEQAEPLLATALGHLACTHEHAKIVNLVATAVDHADALDPGLVVDALGAQARALEVLGRRAEQRQALERLRVHAKKHQLAMDPAMLDAWGRLRFADGDLVEAQRIFDGQLRTATASGQMRVAIRARRSLAGIALREGRFDDARKDLERCLQGARALSDESEVVPCFGMLARLHGQRGERQRVELALENQAIAAERAGDCRQRANAFGGMARRALMSGEFTAAQVHLDRQLRLARGAHARGAELRALRGLGHLHVARGQLSAALTMFEAASSLAEGSGRDLDATRLWIDRARLASVSGDMLAVMRMSMRALSRAQRLSAGSVEVEALSLVGDAALERGDLDEARDWYAQAIGATRNGCRRDAPLWPLLGQARLARSEGNDESLRHALQSARVLASETDYVGVALVIEATSAAALHGSSHGVLQHLLVDGARLTVLERLHVWIELAEATGDPIFGRYARDVVLSLAADLHMSPARLASSTRLYRRVPGFETAASRDGVAS